MCLYVLVCPLVAEDGPGQLQAQVQGWRPAHQEDQGQGGAERCHQEWQHQEGQVHHCPQEAGKVFLRFQIF